MQQQKDRGVIIPEEKCEGIEIKEEVEEKETENQF